MTRTRVGNGWPHVILHCEPRNERHAIEVGNVAPARSDGLSAFAFFQIGAVDTSGLLTPAGRELVTEGVRVRARDLGMAACIVWGPRSCTWLDIRDVEGDDPPLGEPRAGDDRNLPAVVPVPGSWIELHSGCAASHVFLRRLSYDRVEISSAAPMVVGRWDVEGGSRTCRRFRGIEVVARADGSLVGPVQPDGRRSILTSPWPALVYGACCEIAGRTISVDKMYAAWAAVAADQSNRIVTEVHRAA